MKPNYMISNRRVDNYLEQDKKIAKNDKKTEHKSRKFVIIRY